MRRLIMGTALLVAAAVAPLMGGAPRGDAQVRRGSLRLTARQQVTRETERPARYVVDYATAWR